MRMLSIQCDLRVVKLGSSIHKSQMAGLSGQTLQDGPAHRIFAPTSTPLSAQISRKKDIGTVIHARHPAPVKTPSIVKKPATPQPLPQVEKFGKLFDISRDRIAVGGHRGNGQNLVGETGKTVPDTRENTLVSFFDAISHGATFLEFDVQVTADGVPVIWHDNYVVTGDPAAPTFRMISEITLAQFKGLCSSDGFPAAQPLLRQFHKQDGTLMPTFTTWRVMDDCELPTLAEVFASIPAEIGFDIELKMTTPDDQLHTTAAEVSRMSDATLAVVQSFASQDRTLFFSSFCPDMCRHLKVSQAVYPVMFLSDIGAVWHCNPERTSLPAAIQLAEEAKLDGIVVETAELKMKHQHMVELIRDKGLHLLTFGIDNNDADWVRKQQFLGVHAAIVDELPRVSSQVSVVAV